MGRDEWSGWRVNDLETGAPGTYTVSGHVCAFSSDDGKATGWARLFLETSGQGNHEGQLWIGCNEGEPVNEQMQNDMTNDVQHDSVPLVPITEIPRRYHRIHASLWTDDDGDGIPNIDDVDCEFMTAEYDPLWLYLLHPNIPGQLIYDPTQYVVHCDTSVEL